jgi:subtilisin family serine protease
VGRYIVTLDSQVADVRAEAQRIVGLLGQGRVTRVYEHALKGFVVETPAIVATALRSIPLVAAVERDGVVGLAATQTSAPWGLDRVDQRDRPLSGTYTYNQTGAAVTAYIIDTGIHGSHVDFSGRVSPGINTVDSSPSTSDCNGHGTHVAGIVGGETYGMAKDVSLVAVRVFGCEDSTATSAIIAGVDWATGHHQAGQNAVANMSVGGSASAAMDTAVRALIADGVTTAVAAGNDTSNGCSSFSPSRVTEAITVGATDINDARASFSNWGTCVDLHGPGVNIVSAGPASNNATLTISGTSQATPHVAGAAALYLQQNSGASPAGVQAALVSSATNGRISGIKTTCNFIDNVTGGCMTGTPNRLLFVGTGSEPPPPPPPPPPACTQLQRLLGNC